MRMESPILLYGGCISTFVLGLWASKQNPGGAAHWSSTKEHRSQRCDNSTTRGIATTFARSENGHLRLLNYRIKNYQRQFLSNWTIKIQFLLGNANLRSALGISVPLAVLSGLGLIQLPTFPSSGAIPARKGVRNKIYQNRQHQLLRPAARQVQKKKIYSLITWWDRNVDINVV